MSAADLVFWLILIGIAAYVVLAGADFGAGVWDLACGHSRRGDALRGAIHRSVGPVWEANHVWLIFVLVMAWTGFPSVFAAVMSTLMIPLSLGLLGIVLRGSAFAFTPYARGRGRRALDAVFGASSVLAPFMFGAATGAIVSDRVPVGNARGDAWSSWLNPTSVTLGVLAVALCAYLAAVYLVADAQRRDMRDEAAVFRRWALGAGVVTGALALASLLVVRADAERLWDGLGRGDGRAAIAVSVVFGAVALWAVWRRRTEWARAAGAGAVAAVVAGWALAQHPHALPGSLSVGQAAAERSVLILLLWTVGVGAAILVPSLVLLYRMALTDRVAAYHDDADADGDEPPYAEDEPHV